MENERKPRTRIVLLFVIVGTFLVRLGVLLIGYHELSLFTSGADLDVLKHVFFVEHLFPIRYIYDYYGRALEYSPLTPFLLWIISYPLHILGVPLPYAVLVAASLYMSIGSVGTYFLLHEYETPEWLAVGLSVFNPFEVLGVLPWGGFSLVITSLIVTWTIVIEEWRKQGRIGTGVARAIMLGLIMISALAHRTGLILQVVMLVLFVLYEGRKWVTTGKGHGLGNKYMLVLVFTVLIALSFLLYYRVLANTGVYVFLRFSSDLLFARFMWFWGHVVFLYNPFFSLIVLSGLVLWFLNRYAWKHELTCREEKHTFPQRRGGFWWNAKNELTVLQTSKVPCLNIMGRLYLYSSLLLFVVPINNESGVFNSMDLSLRFLNATGSVYLLFYVSVFKVLRAIHAQNRDRGSTIAWFSFLTATISLPVAIVLKAVLGTMKIVSLFM